MTREHAPAGDRRSIEVREIYDRIAGHFAKTRASPWPEVETFLDGSGGEVGLDVGCGNGRHTALLAETCDRAVGVDASRSILAEALAQDWGEGRSFDLVQGGASALPIADERVDVAVYVATLHHLGPRDQRVASLDELARVLSADGVALVSAWSTEHERFDGDEGFDTTVDWTLPGGETVGRFYHIYDPDEFRADVAASDLELLAFELSSGNCYARVTGE